MQSWSLILLVAEVPSNVFIHLETIHKPGAIWFSLDLEDGGPGKVIFLYLGKLFQDILFSKPSLYHMDNIHSEYINIT